MTTVAKPPPCPGCGASDTTFKSKAAQWECNKCKLRFQLSQRIFLSYPHEPDEHAGLVRDVAKAINATRHEAWFDDDKIDTGSDWRERIASGVFDSDWMIVFLSEHALRPGGVCLDEISIALHQKAGDEALLTVLLEDEHTANSPISLTHVQWLDASRFKEYYPDDKNDKAQVARWHQWLHGEVDKLIRHVENRGDITGDITAVRDRLEPASFVAEIAEKAKDFMGRKWVFDAIEAWQTGDREKRVFVVEGAAGIGKSAIAAQLAHQRRTVIGLHFCKHNDISTHDAGILVRTMVFQIASRDASYRTQLLNKLSQRKFEGKKLLNMNAAQLFRELIANLPGINEAGKERKLLVIDGLDEARDADGNNAILDLIENEFNTLPSWLGVVVTTRPQQDVTAALTSSKVLNAEDEDNRADIKNYLRAHLQQDSRLAADAGALEKAVAAASEKSDGVMLYAAELVKSVKQGVVDPLTPSAFPAGLSGIYLTYLKRECRDTTKFHQHQGPLLELVVGSPLPLSERLIMDVLNIDQVAFNARMSALSSLLLTKKQNGEKAWVPFHKSFVDWLVAPEKNHRYQLNGDGAKQLGEYLFALYERASDGEQVEPKALWDIDTLLPACLPYLSCWRDEDTLYALYQWFDKRGRYAAAQVPINQQYQLCLHSKGPEHPGTLTSMNNLASMLYEQGNLDGARKLEEQVLESRRKLLGEEHPATLTSMNNLAQTLSAQGDSKGARKLEEEVLKARRKILGEEHPDTLTSMNNLASTLSAQGDSKGARKLQEQVLEGWRKTLGDEHPDTLTSTSNLATTLHAQGDLGGARKLQDQALESQRKTLGEEHPDTLTSMNNLATTLYEQGDLDGARELQERVLEGSRKILGDEHPDTLASMNNLASTLHAQGDLDGAQELKEQVLEGRRKLLGDEHPDTLSSMGNLATTLYEQGDLDGAQELKEQVLEGRRKTLGDKHPDTLSSISNLASTLFEQGDLKGARKLEEQVLEGRRKLLGDEHPDTLSSMGNLATTLYEQGDLKGARKLKEQVLKGRRKTLGDEHPDTLTTMNNLALMLSAQGDLSGARELQEQVLEGWRKTLGEEHPDTLTSMNNLATALYAQGDLDGAQELKEQVLEARRKTLGEEHPDTLTTMNNLALMFSAQGDLSGARELQEQVLEGWRKTLGEEHPDTLTSMNNLATALYEQGDLDGAQELQEQVLEGRRKLLGDEHPDTLSSMGNLATTLYEQGDLKGARKLEEQVLEGRRKLLGDKHPDTLSSISNLATTLHAQGDLDGAQELKEQVLEGRRKTLGDKHPDTLSSISNLASTLREQGNLSDARDLDEEALKGSRKTLGEEHADTLWSMSSLASTLRDQGELDEAHKLLDQCLNSRRKVQGNNHEDTLFDMEKLAKLLRLLDKNKEAELLEAEISGFKKEIE